MADLRSWGQEAGSRDQAPAFARDLSPGDPRPFAEGLRVAGYPLTAEDEDRLCQRIDSGRQALEALEAQLGLRPRLGGGDVGRLGGRFQRLEDRFRRRGLPEGVDRALVQRAREGREALHRLVLGNLKLAVDTAEWYAAEADQDSSDLVQEGCIGLMRAAERYDPSRGGRFWIYARWWVRHATIRAMADTGGTVRLPVDAYERLRTVRRARCSLFDELGRDPSAEELAARLGWDVAVVVAVDELAKFEMDSLDRPGGDGDGDTSVGGHVPDPSATDPAEVVVDKSLAQMVAGALEELSARQQEVVRLRHGLDGGEPQTRVQIGRRFGVTPQRIHQIEEAAMKRLLRFSRATHLVEYLGGAPARSERPPRPSDGSGQDRRRARRGADQPGRPGG